jgi:glutathione S-transferase
MARILLREFAIPCGERLVDEFPPSNDYFAINPLGQVPALEDGGKHYFPTIIVLKRISEVACAQPLGEVWPRFYREGSEIDDDQLLMVLLAMGDMMVAIQYQKWAGLGGAGHNVLGYVPAERNMRRIVHTLDWLEQRVGDGGFWPSTICVHDIVFTCLMLWSESRGPIKWKGRPGLESIVAKLMSRPSFLATEPSPLPAEYTV